MARQWAPRAEPVKGRVLTPTGERLLDEGLPKRTVLSELGLGACGGGEDPQG